MDHYKVVSLIGISRVLMHTVDAVVDTGAGPNLVRESLLPSNWRCYASRETKVPPIRDANDRNLKIEGVVRLYVDVGGLKARLRFLVCKDLAVKVILGCDFIHKHVQAILPQRMQIVLKDGGSVAIGHKSSKKVNLVRKDPREKLPTRRKKLKRRDRGGVIRLRRKVQLPAFSAQMVKVGTVASGLHNALPSAELMRKHKVSIPYGIIDPKEGTDFVMTLANFSRKKITLRKGTIVGIARERPRYVVCPIATETSKEPEEGSPAQESWLEDAGLDHLDEHTRSKVISLLLEYADICDGRLGAIQGAEHRIDLIEGANPIYQQPYRSGIERRKAEGAEVRRMLQAEVIEPSTSEWASPVILVPKPDGSLRFCVDYRKLNAVTKRDSYPMPRMDE